jgi:hypothetical protein
LDAGIARPSDSHWSTNVLLIAKKNTNDKRLALDYRQLDSFTRLSKYSMLDFPSVINGLASGPAPKLFFTLDLKCGYHQVRMHPDDKNKTAFQVEGLGGLAFTRLPQGVTGAAPFFQRVIELALVRLIPDVAMAYLDNIIGAAPNTEVLLQKFELVLDRFRKAKLKIHPTESHFGVQHVKFLGHVFDQNGFSIDYFKFSIIKNYPVPKSAKDVKKWLGLSGFYRRFLHHYSNTTHPLRQLLKDDTPFVCTPE